MKKKISIYAKIQVMRTVEDTKLVQDKDPLYMAILALTK